MKKRVYIAGPISKDDLLANINQATAAFVALAKAGFAPMCPHWSVYSKPAKRLPLVWSDSPDPFEVICVATPMGNDDMTHADWMGVDLPWVDVADAVLRLPGESTGADLEVGHAIARGIPVYFSVELLIERMKEKGAA